MKKIILSVALLATGFTCINAGTLAEDALIDVTGYELTGTFAQYDFPPTGDNGKFDWAFTTAKGAVYQMRGNAPTDTNLFGWKPANITPPAAQWYMFQVDVDVDGSLEKFEWVLLSADMNNKMAYELQGVNASGSFEYSKDSLSIDYQIDGNTISTGIVGSFNNVTPARPTVSESLQEEADSVVNDIVTGASYVLLQGYSDGLCEKVQQSLSGFDHEAAGYESYSAFIAAGGEVGINFVSGLQTCSSAKYSGSVCKVVDQTIIGGAGTCEVYVKIPEGEVVEQGPAPVVTGSVSSVSLQNLGNTLLTYEGESDIVGTMCTDGTLKVVGVMEGMNMSLGGTWSVSGNTLNVVYTKVVAPFGTQSMNEATSETFSGGSLNVGDYDDGDTLVKIEKIANANCSI